MSVILDSEGLAGLSPGDAPRAAEPVDEILHAVRAGASAGRSKPPSARGSGLSVSGKHVEPLCNGLTILEAAADLPGVEASDLSAFDDLHALTGKVCALVASLAGMTLLETLISGASSKPTVTADEVKRHAMDLSRILGRLATNTVSSERSAPETEIVERGSDVPVGFQPSPPPMVSERAGVARYFDPGRMAGARTSIAGRQKIDQLLCKEKQTAKEHVAMVHALARASDPRGPLRIKPAEVRSVQAMLSATIRLLSVTRADAMPPDEIMRRCSAVHTLLATAAQVRKDLYNRLGVEDLEDGFGRFSKLHSLLHLLESCLRHGMCKGQSTAAYESYNRELKAVFSANASMDSARLGE